MPFFWQSVEIPLILELPAFLFIDNPEALPQSLKGTIFDDSIFEYDLTEDYLRQELLKVFPDKQASDTSDLLNLLNGLDIGDDNCINIQPWEYVSEHEQC